jgi:N-acetylmuramoyl-L-alanine amidase/Zinc carboxypeptidase
VLIGHSVDHRPIVATRVGDPAAQVRVLVVGDIHGNERAGERIVARLRRTHPDGVQLWLIRSANPDGAAAGTRQNARGVDLNRNFPYRWRAGRHGTYYPGPRAASEPETRALMRLVRRIRPQIAIYYHQHLGITVRTRAGDIGLERTYARRTGLPLRSLPAYHGTAVSWENHSVAGTAFVVELRAGPADAARHAAAVLALARAARAARAARSAAAAAPPKPPIKWDPIPFPAHRKREMRAYARRHYGIDDYRLRRPHVIVEHLTATTTFAAAFNTFASDAPDPELHERPGTCAHFIIDRDGTIHQLVSLRLMCRHTVGLNYTAIGIEHVGLSDADVMGDRRELEASLALTRWLQARFHIATRNVIGHNESLSSPYHRERVARLRHQTHADMRRPTMVRYRRLL